MSLNSNDRDKIVKHAESQGYGWNSSGSKMTNGSGGSVKFSDTGHSVKVNGSQYNTSSAAKKSSKW